MDQVEDGPGALPGADLRERQERLLDEALEETFPASDPIAVTRLSEPGPTPTPGAAAAPFPPGPEPRP